VLVDIGNSVYFLSWPVFETDTYQLCVFIVGLV
jgi:hypothetical protein